MKPSKNKMTVNEFLTHHVQYYDGDDVANGIVGVQEITIHGKHYVELLYSGEDVEHLLLAEIEEELLGIDGSMYVVMLQSGTHEYVTGSNGGRYNITFTCSND